MHFEEPAPLAAFIQRLVATCCRLPVAYTVHMLLFAGCALRFVTFFSFIRLMWPPT